MSIGFGSDKTLASLARVLEGIDLPADWIGIRGVRESITRRMMRDGHPEDNMRSLDQGAMVEVLAHGQFGYAATNRLTPEALRAAAVAAYQQAVAASALRLHSFSVEARPPVVGQYYSPQQQPLDGLSPAELCELLSKICRELKVSEQIMQTNATAIANQTESWFVSSNGSEVYQQLALLETHFSATAQSGSVVQTRTNNGYLAHSYQGGWELFPQAALWEQIDRVAHQALELLTAEECPTETSTLVLAPDQMMLQIHESVGHPLELDRILGDERNYAGGSFVKPTDFGQLAYGSPLMNITFDPTVAGEFASYAYDDTGAPATRQHLIRQGRLERGLGSLESQARLGVEGVACARASSWNRPAIDRMANINLEPGETSLADLIGSIERGVFMETNRSWSIDDQRYKFQFGCEYGHLIENGELTRPVRNPNYRATTPDFWHSLVQVGDRNTWEMYGTPYCGKGEPNQVIRVGHAAPVCAFENVEVFGGAQ
ncbi:TldD/PmbA family protein [Pseudanabaena sp. FACHB-2040]|uniref:TldD/PmbA family protein n=1 Tax=Pseudanabaena sp. FACHB-2040 TaxID=2692859 RepID=UPI00168400D3|nr:TldD/PmbA family protein [Pseudanabaena sp. FACHB-2040]MBD2260024.1 TldD/PmbA family protein [Pseudanabaena sp. FACHB-2040]